MRENIERYVLAFVLGLFVLLSMVDIFDVFSLPWFEERILSFILFLLSALIGSWLIEHGKMQNQLARIEKLVAQSAVHPEVIQTTERAMDYLSQRFTEAKRCVDQAAVAPSLGSNNAYHKYDQRLSRVLKKNVVTYRHVTLVDPVRWKRIRAFLEDQRIQKYYVRYYELDDSNIPGLSYAIIDEEEVVMRYPYEPGQPALWLSIKQPDVVRLFVRHFRNMWNQGSRLDKNSSEDIEQLDSRYSQSVLSS